MDGATLQDLVSKGLGVAARRTGIPYIVYRPHGTGNPLSTRNRIIKFYAAFAPINGVATGATGYAGILWRGVFDSSYTAPGDYLQGPETNFFIASQWPNQSVLCVQTGNVVTISRPQTVPGSGYSGFVAGTAQQVIAGWPALLTVAAARIAGTLPEARFGSWSAFLPALPASPQIADILIDDLGRQFVVAATQLSNLGCRLSMRQVDG